MNVNFETLIAHSTQMSLTMLFDVLHDAPNQQRDLMPRLSTVMHLLQGDPEHSGSAEGVIEGSREALPHRLHSLAASVRLHTETSRARLRRPPGSTPPYLLWVGWRLKQQTKQQNKLEIGIGPLPSLEAVVLITRDAVLA